MKQVPYHGNPGNACALACYTMVGQYLLPDTGISFESFGELSKWHKGYVVWEYPVWKWLMDNGVKIHSYASDDIEAWVEHGIVGLQGSVSEKEYQYYVENTFDLNETVEDLKTAFRHPRFLFEKKQVTWDDVIAEVQKPGICDITLDGRKLHKTDGFTVHRVVIIDINDQEVTFHDPIEDSSGAYAVESVDHFRSAVESLSGPALTRYESPNVTLSS